MPKAKKKFIDKKNAVTFHLVHRSQQDPLAADEKAPQHVLVAASEKKKKKGKTSSEEEQKFGIFFDDDYDYLQHLRDTSKQSVHWIPVDTGNNSGARVLKKKGQDKEDEDGSDEEVYIVERTKQLTLPSSVFASEVEEDVGLLNKAAPQSGLRLDLDPDIVAAMDEDFNFEDPDNELEDNFMELANAQKDGDDEEYDDSDNSDFNISDDDYEDDDSEARDEVGSLDGRGPCPFEEEETRSRFTDYSMSSSVMRRNQGLSLLDQRFEKMFESYDDNEIGALDCEEIEGFVPTTSDILLQCADEFGKEQASVPLDMENAVKPNLNATYSSDSGDDLCNMEVKGSDDEEKWDCQSILSTYSNIYNRPKLISERNSNPGKIRISKKTGMPVGVFESGSEKLTVKALAKLDAEQGQPQTQNPGGRAESIISTLSTLSIRPKNETPEERRQRKKLLKEYRRERIAERKANTEAFKEERKRQEKIILNNKKNIPTVHIA